MLSKNKFQTKFIILSDVSTVLKTTREFNQNSIILSKKKIEGISKFQIPIRLKLQNLQIQC